MYVNSGVHANPRVYTEKGLLGARECTLVSVILVVELGSLSHLRRVIFSVCANIETSCVQIAASSASSAANLHQHTTYSLQTTAVEVGLKLF